MINAQGATRLEELVTRLLDRRYTSAAAATLRAVGASTSSGIVAQRLNELDTEVGRLVDLGQRLTVDNPVMRALLADLDAALRQDARRIAEAAPALQEGAVDAAGTLTRQLAIPGVTDETLARVGIRWNIPNPEAVGRAVGYVQSEAWRDELSRYADNNLQVIRNQALRGIIEGWSPLRTAREIRRTTQDLPQAQANTLMRTLQLTAYRDATAINQQANASILSYQIRVGTLDGRICMACLALHGTRLPIGERVNDHHNGRCVGVAQVRGFERQVVTGEEWFNRLPESRQREIAGVGAYDLLRSGRAQLRDFVQTYSDPVYDQMIREASLQSVLERARV